MPGRVDNLDIALDGDGGQIQHGPVQTDPQHGFTVEQDAQPVAASSAEAQWKYLEEECDTDTLLKVKKQTCRIQQQHTGTRKC